MLVLAQILNGVLLGGVYALFAVGLTLLLGIVGVFDVAHGAEFALVAIAGAKIAQSTGAGLLLLCVIGCAIGAGLGLALEFVAVRPIRRRGVGIGDASLRATLISTLAVLLALNAVNIGWTNGQPFRYPSRFSYGGFLVAGISIQYIYVVAFLVATVVLILLWFGVRRTQQGRALRAVAEDGEAAEMLGVSVNAYSAMSLAVSGALAGLAGILLGVAFSAVDYGFGDNFLYRGFVIVIIGGLGSILGTLAAGVLLGVAEGLVSYFIGGQWQPAVAFTALMLVLVLRPSGLFGVKEVDRS
jgi:branched-chain amino acid transport system permease protein